MGHLSGHAIVLTGAGRGIGRACALAAAAEGASVVVNDLEPEVARSAAAEIRAGGGRAVAVPCDITDWAAARALIASCIDEYGHIDGLVNNAGRFGLAEADRLDEAQVRAMFETNVLGVIACGTHALSAMAASRRGTIVNVVSGAHFGIPHMSIYGATKGAVASLTYAWAAEFAGRGIRVNAVSPLAQTRMLDVTATWFADRSGRDVGSDNPAPEVNAPVVVYLLSEASEPLNGQIVRIEGDQLSVVAHPVVRHPVVRGTWTVAALKEAFAGPLAQSAVPLGMGWVARTEYLDGASSFWDDAG